MQDVLPEPEPFGTSKPQPSAALWEPEKQAGAHDAIDDVEEAPPSNEEDRKEKHAVAQGTRAVPAP